MGDQETQRLLDNSPTPPVSSGCGTTAACDPHRTLHRYLVLILICFQGFGQYFCFDTPASLQDNMLRDLQLSETQYMAFYSYFSWPNVIMCFVGGYLTDRVFGIRVGTVIFCCLVIIGQVLFATGAYQNHLWLMYIGRVILGIGGECISVVQNTHSIKWYKGKELSLVFGIRLSSGRLFTTMTMNTMGPLYRYMESLGYHGYKCLGLVLYIAGISGIIGLGSAILLAYLDKRADRILNREMIVSKRSIKLSDVKKFPSSIWLLSIPMLGFYGTVFSFVGLGLVFFELKYDLDPGIASNVNSIAYIMAGIMYPIFGFIIDKTGRNLFWEIFGLLCTITSMVLVAFTYLNPYIPMVFLGISYPIFATSFWPLAGMIVPEQQTGTVYGILLSIQNLGLSINTLVSGAIVDSRGYLILIVFFLILLSLGLMAALVVYIIDSARGGKLNLSAKQRRCEKENGLN